MGACCCSQSDPFIWPPVWATLVSLAALDAGGADGSESTVMGPEGLVVGAVASMALAGAESA